MRRLAAGLILALLAVLVPATSLPAPAYSARSEGNVTTPGDFRGHGFDQCVAPTQQAMNTWLRHSPFLAVGIYISGDSRGCREQPNLTPTWVSRQLRKGWRLLPITLGPQASCHPSFPRYGDDETIKSRPGKGGRYKPARRQGRREAIKAVAAADALGIVPTSTLWYDLEGFDLGNTRCRESALAFLSAWTSKLHRLDYVSGVYSSAGSGIKMLDDARVERPGEFDLPDMIWIARWDGKANTRTDYIRNDGWRPGGRMKQYRGGHHETWGGVTINIDSNWLKLGRGAYAPPVEHCDGVDVDHRSYKVLREDTDATALVKALQCLLQEKSYYGGRLHGRYNPRTIAAVNAWQSDHGFTASSTWGRVHWMSLLTDGSRPVLKFGSAGEDVRRIQRALNATSATLGLPVNGIYTRRTAAAVKDWQAEVGQNDNAIVVGRTWRALGKGRR